MCRDWLRTLPISSYLSEGIKTLQGSLGPNNKKLFRDAPKDDKSSRGMLKKSSERHSSHKELGEEPFQQRGDLQRRLLLTRNFKSWMWSDMKILSLMCSSLKAVSPEATLSLWSGSIDIDSRMQEGVLCRGLVHRGNQEQCRGRRVMWSCLQAVL